MSTMALSTVAAMDVRPREHGHDMSHLHPRERGFRVLSRIARVHADGAEYSPRHRRDVPVDLALGTPIAS